MTEPEIPIVPPPEVVIPNGAAVVQTLTLQCEDIFDPNVV